jgi:hypothetical protein
MSAPIDCVAPGGFSMNGTNAAAPCLASTYAPPLNRLAKCLRCQSGLAEDPADALADSQRTNRRTVCRVFSRLPPPPLFCVTTADQGCASSQHHAMLISALRPLAA